MLQLADLMVSCIQGPVDLTLAVRSCGDHEWSTIPYLYLYLENQDDPNALNRISNSKDLIGWFAMRFFDVNAQLCDPNAVSRKSQFLRFQEQTHQQRLQADRDKVKALSPAEWRSIGPGRPRN